MPIDCIDLRTVGRYRLFDEVTGERATKLTDPWELVIPGKSGSVSPFGGDLLLASTRSMTTTRRILAAVPSAVVTQDADDGQNISFPASALEIVAGILGLKRRRVLSETRKAQLADLSRQHSPIRQSDKSTRQSTISTQDGCKFA